MGEKIKWNPSPSRAHTLPPSFLYNSSVSCGPRASISSFTHVYPIPLTVFVSAGSQRKGLE